MPLTAEWVKIAAAYPQDPAAAVRAFVGDREFAWLDSAETPTGAESASRFSLVARGPLAILEQFDGEEAILRSGGRVIDRDANGWTLWRRALAKIRTLPTEACRLAPGWIGYVGFEMARQLERLPASRRESLGLPLLRLGLYDRAIVLDHWVRKAWLLAASGVAEQFGGGEEPADATRADWRLACEISSIQSEPDTEAPSQVQQEITAAAYERMIRSGLEYIAAGDIYQVNLAHCLELSPLGDARAVYRRLRALNPAPYAAQLHWAGGDVLSVSPELFLHVRDGGVLTRPIKGTRPRTGDDGIDAAQRSELLASAKEAAELAMIVDLHRNDLGRVCEFGSVRVPHARRLETHPTVFHTVADVVGRLRPEHDALDLLKACFPAGSISGVPKIRALEIIDELEASARGVYTGAIGVLGLDGQMTFNVAIRTLQVCRQRARLYVGGGIVTDSVPDAEYAETFAKGRGILQALRQRDNETTRQRGELCENG